MNNPNSHLNEQDLNAINTNDFEELPPNEEDEQYGLIEMEGNDMLGHRHVYYVYEDPETKDLIMSIGEPDFLEDYANERPNIKASKKFFKDQKYILELRNQNRKRYIEAIERDNAVNRQQTDEERTRLALMKQNIRIYDLKIKNRPTLTNRLELYKTTRNLMSIYDKTKDRLLIKELIIQMNQLVDNVIDEDLQKQDAVHAQRRAVLAERRYPVRQEVLVPETPEVLVPETPEVLVPETPRELVTGTPLRATVLFPVTPASNEPPAQRRRGPMDGGSRRNKSIRKNKKTLKSSNKLKKTNKKTRKVKSRK